MSYSARRHSKTNVEKVLPGTEKLKKVSRSRPSLKERVKSAPEQKAKNKTLDAHKGIMSTRNGKYWINIEEIFSYIKKEKTL